MVLSQNSGNQKDGAGGATAFSPGLRLGEDRERFNVVVFTDEPAAAAGLVRALSAISVLKLCAVCDDLGSLEAALCALKPTLLILDQTGEVTFPVIVELRRRVPSCCIVLWARTISPPSALQAAEHGVCGILRKTAPMETFFKCLDVVIHGGLWFEELLKGDDREREYVRLTQREGQLLGLVASGLKNKEAAGEMGITEGSAKVYLSRLFKKLGADNRTELAIHALRNPWAASPTPSRQESPAGRCQGVSRGVTAPPSSALV